MVQRTSEKASRLDPVSGPIPGGYLVPVGNPGLVSYKARKDSLTGYTSVTEYSNVVGDGAYDCTAGLTTAVATAAASGVSLFWPAGNYLTTASVPLLHTVRHVGPGIIRRGSDDFQLQAKPSTTNRIYVSASGSAANDGLSSSQPTTLGQAADIVTNYGPVLDGTWRVVLAAGTYTAVNISFATPSRKLFYVQGPSVGGPPNVPTAILSGATAGSSDFGVRATGPGVQIMWKDLKFDGYDTSVNNIALLSDYGSDLWWDNVHISNSTGQGIYGEACRIVRGGGMIIDGCRQGILLNACGMVTLGYGYSDPTKNIVRNCTQAGVEWSRGTNGHCDYVDMTSNAVGIDVFHDSRVHIMGCTFTSNTVAERSRSGGYFLNDTSLTNTFTTNTLNQQSNAYSGETDSDLWVSISERRRGYSANSITHTGTTTKTTLLNPWTIPQGFFCAPTANTSTKKIRVVVHGQFTTAGALSRIGVDFDSVQIDQSIADAPGANTKFRYEVEIWADGNSAQYKSATLYQNGAVAIHAQASAAQNMANAARNLNITGQLANAGDSMRIDRTEVWVSG